MKSSTTLSLLIAVLAGLSGYTVGTLLHRPEATPVAEPATRMLRFYQSPMHPWIKSDRPGKCTICGMDLVAVYEGDAGFDAKGGILELMPTTASVIGVQTTEVQRATLSRTLRVTGVLDDDETRHRYVSAHVPGRIEKLFANQVGATIKTGDPLVTLYSPELLTAQRTHLERLRAGPSAFTASERAETRERLLAMGMLPENIDALETTGRTSPIITVYATQDGTIVTKTAYEGQYVDTHDKLLEIGDFSQLWFIFDAYEADLPWLQVGQMVEVSSPSMNGRTQTSPIIFIDPNLNEATRTARVRVVLDNTGGRLPHRATATGRVLIETPSVLVVPRSAVLHTQGTPLVYVDRGDGHYQPRHVRLGRAGTVAYEVLDGLNAGERVVTQGALLLDSQAQLARAPQAAASPEPAPPPVSLAAAEALHALAIASARAAELLSWDNLDGYNDQLPSLRTTLSTYLAAHPDAPPALLSADLAPAGNLKAAREAFEPFSTAVADLFRKLPPGSTGGLKIYQCPMTPVLGTGRWLQTGGPLRNPFFGSEMLECGEALK